MRRLFTRKSVDDTKVGKVEEAKEGKSRKSLFGRSHGIKNDEPVQEPQKPQQQFTNQPPNQHDNSTNSSGSSAVSIPPSAAYLPTPTGSSSSFSSVASCNDASPSSSVLTAPSTAPSSTLSRSPNSDTSISSSSSAASPSKSLVVPPPSSVPTSRPQSSHTEQKKPLSPLSAVVDLPTVHTPPTSDDDEDEGLHPKRRNSIYNIFRKSQSQPNLNSDPPSRSSSTTTLPSAYTAPQGSGSMQRPSSAHNHRKTVSFLRRKSSNHSFEDVVDGDGILSRDEATARRAILQGDPLGGGAYHYPMGLACKSDLLHQPPVPHASRTRRGAAGRTYDPRRSWQGGQGSYGNGGMAWRAPHIGGRNGGRMTIEEENDLMEQQQHQQREGKLMPGGFIEETPQFQQPQQQRLRPPMNRRPTSSQSGRRNSSGYGYYNGGDHPRSGYYPPFAPSPMLPVINQQPAQSVPA